MMFRNSNIVRQHAQRIEREIKGMVTIMGNDALNFFKDSFVNQGFIDKSYEPWQQRKTTRDRGRGILIKTGDLKRSLKKRNNGQWSVIISTDKPYAEIHNEGLTGMAFGKHPFKMPKRQFMGPSAVLTEKLRVKFDQRIRTLFP